MDASTLVEEYLQWYLRFGHCNLQVLEINKNPQYYHGHL